MTRTFKENCRVLLQRVERGDVSFALPRTGPALERRSARPYATFRSDENLSRYPGTPEAPAIRQRIADIAFQTTENRSFAKAVTSDFDAIIFGIGYADPRPWFNGIWLSYLLGKLPWVELHPIPGHLGSLLTLSHEEAARLWNEAQAREAAWLASSRAPLLPRRCITTSELHSDPHLLRGGHVATSPDELWSDAVIPATWLALLQDQVAGGVPHWGRFWESMADLLPSVLFFLRHRCLGVAIVQEADQQFPMLYYIYTMPNRPGTSAKRYFAARGGVPLGDQFATESCVGWDLMPPELHAFYRTIHNGWGKLSDIRIPAVEDLFFLTKEHLTKDPGREGDDPFHCHQALSFARSEDPSTILCLYPESTDRAAQAPSRAVLLKGDDFPGEVVWGVDFWPELDRIFHQELRWSLLRPDQYHPGTHVEVLDAPFQGCFGEIHSVDATAHLATVLLPGYDRPFPIQVSLDYLV